MKTSVEKLINRASFVRDGGRCDNCWFDGAQGIFCTVCHYPRTCEMATIIIDYLEKELDRVDPGNELVEFLRSSREAK